jgi:Do/DeqQ family serine protease
MKINKRWLHFFLPGRDIKPWRNLIVFIILFFTITFPGFSDIVFPDASRISPLKGKNRGTPVYEIQKSFRKIYDLYKDSVVFISTEKTVNIKRHPFFSNPFFGEFFGPGFQKPYKHKRSGLGTGFIISSDGYLCTNHHVIAQMDKVMIKVGGKEYEAKIIGSDKLSDIALLKIQGDGKFKPVYLGNSQKIRVGDWSIAIGNPFGLDKTFTVGVISAAGREVGGGVNSFIQTDATINPGNSGGPLINLDGEVIGVNRMIYSRSGGSLGIGFAIPINTAIKVLKQLRQHKKVKRGYIGVQIAPLTVLIAKQLGLKSDKGALIGGVVPGGPADKAGIKEKDIVLKAANKKVESFQDLVRIVSDSQIGKAIKVTVWRDRKIIYQWVIVKERPNED